MALNARRMRLFSMKTRNRISRYLSTDVYSALNLDAFVQTAPVLTNLYEADSTLQKFLNRSIHEEHLPEIRGDLHRFGDRICSEVDALGRECELNPPKLNQFDAWGRRIDELITCDAWKRQKVISAEEGLISIGYTRPELGAAARLYQYAKLYMYSSASGLYSCPLAMTDGAAKTIKDLDVSDLTGDAFSRLTSRIPEEFWTSGQWMTERMGGSDVAGLWLRVNFRYIGTGFQLKKIKVGREFDENGKLINGNKGLSLFFVRVRDEHSGLLNDIQIIRLKDKLGTRQLPTAELLLNGTKAVRLSPVGRGIASISNMLNITRLHNSISATAAMRRIVCLARDYATKRQAFGQLIIDWPLHARTLAQMEMYTRACTLLSFRLVHLLGKMECDEVTDAEKLIHRLITPVAKLFTAKCAMKVVSEGLEAFGGIGYMEDSGLPSILRDAQVLPIWEGTTNVLSLDVCRVLGKEGSAVFEALQDDLRFHLRQCLKQPEHPLHVSANNLLNCLPILRKYAQPDLLPYAARDFSFTLAKVYAGAQLIHQASYEDASPGEQLIAKRWCQNVNQLRPICDYKAACNDKSVVME